VVYEIKGRQTANISAAEVGNVGILRDVLFKAHAEPSQDPPLRLGQRFRELHEVPRPAGYCAIGFVRIPHLDRPCQANVTSAKLEDGPGGIIRQGAAGACQRNQNA
jgi:hypothetical protein